MKTRASGFLLAFLVLLLGPLGTRNANAQASNWRVTVLEVTSGGEVICSNAAVNITIPGPVGTAAGNVCGVTGTLTVEAQRVIFDLTGSLNIQACVWNITAPIRGSGFISGNAVPATSMTGTAQTRNCRGGNYTNAVTGSFQASRVVAGGGGPGIVGFTGQVQVTRPGRAAVLLTAADLGQALPPGTRIVVNANSTLTVRYADGDVALGEKTIATIVSPRFFLLVPWRVPQQRSFMRIVWRCIPNVDGCATIATPNTRLAFLPPLRPRAGGAGPAGALADTTDVTVSVAYTETGGMGSSVVTVEAGTVQAEDLAGRVWPLSAGQAQTIRSFAAGGEFVNLDADEVSPDLFTYDPGTGAFAQQLGGGMPASTGVFSPGWTVVPADFDGNGLTDFLLYSTAAQTWTIAINDARGGFYEHDGTLSVGDHTHVLNLNGDRLSDVLVHAPSTGRYWAGMNIDGGYEFLGFEGSWPAGAEAYPIKLNADDAVDMLLFNATSGAWSWAVSDGIARFTYPASGTWSNLTSVYPGDFNGDGLGDVLLYNSRTGAWSMAKNTGSGFTIQRSGTWASGQTLVPGDLDADADADVVLYDVASGRWSLQVSDRAADGTERFTAAATGTWAGNLQVSGADFNADGKLDLLLYASGTGEWAKVTNGGNGTFTMELGAWDPALTTVASQSLVQGPFPNEPAREPCTSEADLRGVATDTASEYITFLNYADAPRKIYKLASDGRRQLVSTLESYSEDSQRTARLQPWVVTDENDSCLGIYVPGEAASLVYWPTIAVLQ